MEQAFVAARDGFYQATVTATGWPYVQFRGGPVGFLKVLDAKTIAYADLLYRALELSARLYRPIEILTLVVLVFFVMLTLTSILIRYMESRLDAARL